MILAGRLYDHISQLQLQMNKVYRYICELRRACNMSTINLTKLSFDKLAAKSRCIVSQVGKEGIMAWSEQSPSFQKG